MLNIPTREKKKKRKKNRVCHLCCRFASQRLWLIDSAREHTVSVSNYVDVFSSSSELKQMCFVVSVDIEMTAAQI